MNSTGAKNTGMNYNWTNSSCVINTDTNNTWANNSGANTLV